MAILKRFHTIVGSKTAENDGTPVDDSTTAHVRADDKEAAHLPQEVNETETPSEDAQPGVKKIEAVTLTWSKSTAWAVLVLIWFLTLVNDMRASIFLSLSPYATSTFYGQSLLTVISIVSFVMGGAVYIPMAKALDLWGRAEGFLTMTLFCIIGLILLAACQNLPTYCAGQVFYTVGFGGLQYTWDVLATDVTTLRNRGLAFAFTSSPALISAFGGSKAAASFVANNNWRWGYGMFAIILPAITIPIYGILAFYVRKAEKQGIIVKEKKNWKITPRTIWWTIIEFDLPGVVLFAGGFVVFLLPFTLAATAPNGYQTGYIIAMIVVGIVVIFMFGLYETFLAPVPFLKYEHLTDRTVLGACLLDMTYQVSYYCYALNLTSFLQVVYEVDVATAGYITNTFSVVSFVFLFVAGGLIRWTGRFKWILWVCVPLYILGTGLMINFRTPGGYIGYIVMCEIFFSIAGGIFILCCQLAVLASVDHQHVSTVLALLFVMGSIGGSIGSAISGAIWTNTFLHRLQQTLPESAMPKINLIYGSLTEQLSYPVGSPTRDAIVESYGYGQTRMLIAATCFMVLCFPWVGMMRNLNVKTMTQTKGNTL